MALQRDGQIRVDELPALQPRQDPADAVPEVGSGGDTFERADGLPGDDWHAQADPVRRRTRAIEASHHDAVLDAEIVERGIVGLRSPPRPCRPTRLGSGRRRRSVTFGRHGQIEDPDAERRRTRNLRRAGAERGLDELDLAAGTPEMRGEHELRHRDRPQQLHGDPRDECSRRLRSAPPRAPGARRTDHRARRSVTRARARALSARSDRRRARRERLPSGARERKARSCVKHRSLHARPEDVTFAPWIQPTPQ